MISRLYKASSMILRRNPHAFAAASFCLLVCGCEVAPKYKKPNIDLPKSACLESELSEFIKKEWWTVFQDPVLEKLEVQAINHNADLRQAVANIEEAMAFVNVADSNLSPSVGIGSRVNDATNSRKTGMPYPRHSASRMVGFVASYELDFFGKYASASKAARASLLASKAGKDAILLTVTAEVAKCYFALRTLDAKLSIAKRTLTSRTESYNVYGNRFRNGYCTELDYRRVEAELAGVKASVYDIENAIAKTESALHVLIGSSPREIVDKPLTRGKSLESLSVPSSEPNNIPATLLSRRPDVLQAEGALIAANAKVAEAIAAYFPSISLTSNIGYEAQFIGHMFTGGAETVNLITQLSQPLFTGGKITEAKKAAKAKYKRLLAAYEKTVQCAFKEAKDAIVANKLTRSVLASRITQMHALKRSYYLATEQKAAGIISLIELLDVERGLLAAEMEVANASQNTLNAVVDLCKAVGGGWRESDIVSCKAKPHIKAPNR